MVYRPLSVGRVRQYRDQERLVETVKLETGLLHATDELRELILQNPELPLLVFAGEDSNNGEWGYMSCSSVKAAIGEFLDCEQTVNDERCFTDRDDFQEEMEDKCDFTGTDEEFAEYIKARMAEYEPYWKPCIILYVDN